MLGRPLEALRTWPAHGEPELRPAGPAEVRRGGGSIEPKVSLSPIGLSIRLGVDELANSAVATFPKRKGGSGVSALCGLCGTLLVDANGFVRRRLGRVTGRLRLGDC